jgi:hypothetical protein
MKTRADDSDKILGDLSERTGGGWNLIRIVYEGELLKIRVSCTATN